MSTPRVTGLKDLRRSLRMMGQRYDRAAQGAIYRAGVGVAADSVRLTPVDTGRLRATTYVGPPEQTRYGYTVSVGVGTDYAVPVHEKHPSKDRFLKKALDAWRAKYAEFIAKNVQALAEAGRGYGMSRRYGTSPQDPGAAWQRERRKAKREQIAARRKKGRKTRKTRRHSRRAKK